MGRVILDSEAALEGIPIDKVTIAWCRSLSTWSTHDAPRSAPKREFRNETHFEPPLEPRLEASFQSLYCRNDVEMAAQKTFQNAAMQHLL
jgi:hypothetical protein